MFSCLERFFQDETTDGASQGPLTALAAALEEATGHRPCRQLCTPLQFNLAEHGFFEEIQ